MGWQGRLALRFRKEAGRTVVHDSHVGPLRQLRSLYPEAPSICHSVLLHPPGGLVGGDSLDVDLSLAGDAHALVTTPGATRFYRSTGEPATQSVRLRAQCGSRLEWLPLESIAYSGCIGANRIRIELDPGAETIGWDVTALGLPASGLPFERGRFTQTVEVPGCWLERGTVRGDDASLLDSPLGWAGHRVFATLWFAAGGAIAESRRDALLDAARDAFADHALRATAGATAPHIGIVVVRVLAPRVEPAMELLVRIWAAWRREAWHLPAVPPRVWRT